MPFPLLPVQGGAEVNAATLWHNFLQLYSVSGLSFSNADTTDGFHATEVPGSGVIPVTNSTGYIPDGFINPTVLSGLGDDIFIKRQPSGFQSAVRAMVENDTSTSTFIVANLNTNGSAVEGRVTGAGSAGKFDVSGLSGIGAELKYSGASGTSTTPILKATFNNGANRPFAEFYNNTTKVFSVDASGGVTASGDVSANRLILGMADASVAPMVVQSSGLVSKLNADLLDGHHYTELASLIMSGTGFVPVSGGQFSGPVGFTEIYLTSTYDDRSPVRIWSQAVTSEFPVQSWTVAGTQDVWRAYSSSSGISGDLLGSLDSNGNLFANGYGEFETVVLNPATSGGPVIITASSGLNTNLNADLLDGKHSTDFVGYQDAILTHPEDYFFDGIQSGVHANIRSEEFGLPAFYSLNNDAGRAGMFVNTGSASGDLVTNGDYEIFSNYTWYHSDEVAYGWTPFNSESPNGSFIVEDGNYYADDSTQKFHGNYSQRMIRDCDLLGNGHIGIAKAISVVSGESYNIAVYGLLPSGISGVTMGLAVNSSGSFGINNADNVVTSTTTGAWTSLSLSGVVANDTEISVMPYISVSGSSYEQGSISGYSFEESTHAATDPWCIGQVTDGWNDFVILGPGATPGHPATIDPYSGVLFVASGTTYFPYHLNKVLGLSCYNTIGVNANGVYQTISTVSGDKYTIKARFLNGTTTPVYSLIGIDPSGGTDPSGVGVIWKQGNLKTAGGENWQSVTSDEFTSNGSSSTVFIGISGLDNHGMTTRGYIDQIEMAHGTVTSFVGSGWFDYCSVSGANPSVGAVPPLYAESEINDAGASAAELNTANGALTGGIPPILTNSQALNINLNADMVDGLHAIDIITGTSLLKFNEELSLSSNATNYVHQLDHPYVANKIAISRNGLKQNTSEFTEIIPASGTISLATGISGDIFSFMYLSTEVV